LEGSASPSAPIEKEEKMLGTVGWVGNFGVVEACLWLILSLKYVHLIVTISTMAALWLQIK